MIRPRMPALCWGLALSSAIVAAAPSVQGLLRFERIEAEPWRVITGVLVHTGTWHLLLGVAGLFLAGYLLERGVGAATLAVVGLNGALGAGLIAQAFDPGLPGGGVGVLLLAWGGANVMFSESKPNAFAAQCLLIVLFSAVSDVKWHSHFAAVILGLVAGVPRAFSQKVFFIANAVLAVGCLGLWVGVLR